MQTVECPALCNQKPKLISLHLFTELFCKGFEIYPLLRTNLAGPQKKSRNPRILIYLAKPLVGALLLHTAPAFGPCYCG